MKDELFEFPHASKSSYYFHLAISYLYCFVNICFRFTIAEKIQEGCGGMVFRATDIITNTSVAIKIAKLADDESMMEEADLLKRLDGIMGVPQLYWEGFHEDRYCLAMDLLGDDLLETIGLKGLSMKDVLMLVTRVIGILEAVHSKGLLHLDIKPENLMFGLKDQNQVYLIDFGMSEIYMENGRHVDSSDECQRRGTPAYASLRCHSYQTQSRRDDLESFGYTLLMILNHGTLPWSSDPTDGFDDIFDKKRSITAEEMFEGFPHCFTHYMRYIKSLGYADEPDYNYLRSLFEHEMRKWGIVDDGEFDFNKRNAPTSQSLDQRNSSIGFTASSESLSELRVRKSIAESSPIVPSDSPFSLDLFLPSHKKPFYKIPYPLPPADTSSPVAIQTFFPFLPQKPKPPQRQPQDQLPFSTYSAPGKCRPVKPSYKRLHPRPSASAHQWISPCSFGTTNEVSKHKAKSTYMNLSKRRKYHFMH